MQKSTEYLHKQVALFITSFGSFLIAFMDIAINISLPAIGTELQMTVIGLS